MALMLPGPVVHFLGAIGITWPDVDEDHVREFGGHVAEFARGLESTHSDATTTLTQLGESYQGAGYEQLMSVWGQMSSSHMSELVTACHAVATAMDVAAGVIMGMKSAAIGELVGMAIAFAAAQVAAAATFGIAEAAVVAIEQAGRFLMKELVRQIVDYLSGQVIEAAIGPLVEKVAAAVSGLVFQGVADSPAVPQSRLDGAVMIDTPTVRQHAIVMQQHAAAVIGHAETFATAAAGMSF